MREYAPLALTLIAPGARVAEPMAPGRVTLDDPAFSVMTDLREVSAATTRPEETIDAAHAQMIRRAVRLLFVLDANGIGRRRDHRHRPARREARALHAGSRRRRTRKSWSRTS